MHETVLWRDLRRTLEGLAAGARPGERVTSVTIRVGPLAHLPPALLRERWSELASSPGLSAARLTLEVGPPPPDPASGEIRIVAVTLDDGVATEGG